MNYGAPARGGGGGRGRPSFFVSQVQVEEAEPEVVAMAEYLGMDPAVDRQWFWIAEEALDASTAPGWIDHVDKDGYEYYEEIATKRVTREHPLDPFYRELYQVSKRNEVRGAVAARTMAAKRCGLDEQIMSQPLKDQGIAVALRQENADLIKQLEEMQAKLADLSLDMRVTERENGRLVQDLKDERDRNQQVINQMMKEAREAGAAEGLTEVLRVKTEENQALVRQLEEARAASKEAASKPDVSSLRQIEELEDQLRQTRNELAKEADMRRELQAAAMPAGEMDALKAQAAAAGAAQAQAAMAARAQAEKSRAGAGASQALASASEIRAEARALRSGLKELRQFMDRQFLSTRGTIHALVESVGKNEEKLLLTKADAKRMFIELLKIKGNIRVFCRIRPFNSRERAENAEMGVEIDWDDPSRRHIKVLEAPAQNGHSKVNAENYQFDRCFGMDSKQSDIFEDVQGLIQASFEGFNITVFAYGQTGSGKTWTMEGSPEDPGITRNTFKEVIAQVRAVPPGMRISTRLSMLEVYNEEIRDLLPEGGRAKAIESGIKYEVKQDETGANYVTNLREVECHTIEDFMEAMRIGSSNRATGATNMNAHSSRSHLVMTIKIVRFDTKTRTERASKISLIDLAGSERLSKSQTTGQMMKESIAINKSLSALGDVINNLAAAGKGAKFEHIPFRNSKLTHLLQDSLGRDSKTLLLIAASPASTNAHETNCTLKFAARAAAVDLSGGGGGGGGGGGDAGKFKAQVESLMRQRAESEAKIRSLSDQLASSGGKGGTGADTSQLERTIEKLKSDAVRLKAERDEAREGLGGRVGSRQDLSGSGGGRDSPSLGRNDGREGGGSGGAVSGSLPSLGRGGRSTLAPIGSGAGRTDSPRKRF